MSLYPARAFAHDRDTGQRYVAWGIAVSLVIHILLALLVLTRSQVRSLPQRVMDVTFVTLPERSPSPPAPERQIVSSPQESPEKAPPPDTRYLSERDASTPRQQIKRGDAPDAGPQRASNPAAHPEAAANAPATRAREASARKNTSPSSKTTDAAPQPKERAHAKAPGERQELKELLLDDATLLEKFSVTKPAPARSLLDPAEVTRSGATATQPFSRPAGSGAAFIGMRGTNDYLPNLPDGDITLLNTKADKFAVFVRRVATQVFAQIRLTGWDALRAGDIHRIGDYSVVHAVLNPQGELIKVTLESSSGSSGFDEVLLKAVRAGARDPNPPASAKGDDGNFHFIFKSKSWSQMSSNARTGAPYERRWLLLATGLL